MAFMTHTIEPVLDHASERVSRARTRNSVVGTVVARGHESPPRYYVRTATGSLIDCVRQPEQDRSNPIDIGHHVTLDIAAEDVCLEHPDASEPAQTNHWPGRVVFASYSDSESVVTIKILGQPWTLVSSQLPYWLDRPAGAWDRATVHIPPEAIRIVRRYPGHPYLRPRLLRQVMSRVAR